MPPTRPRQEKKVLSKICLACGAENDAREVVCRKCGKPLRGPEISERRDVMEKIASFAVLIIVVIIVVLVLLSLEGLF